MSLIRQGETRSEFGPKKLKRGRQGRGRHGRESTKPRYIPSTPNPALSHPPRPRIPQSSPPNRRSSIYLAPYRPPNRRLTHPPFPIPSPVTRHKHRASPMSTRRHHTQCPREEKKGRHVKPPRAHRTTTRFSLPDLGRRGYKITHTHTNTHIQTQTHRVRIGGGEGVGGNPPAQPFFPSSPSLIIPPRTRRKSMACKQITLFSSSPLQEGRRGWRGGAVARCNGNVHILEGDEDKRTRGTMRACVRVCVSVCVCACACMCVMPSVVCPPCPACCAHTYKPLGGRPTSRPRAARWAALHACSRSAAPLRSVVRPSWVCSIIFLIARGWGMGRRDERVGIRFPRQRGLLL